MAKIFSPGQHAQATQADMSQHVVQMHFTWILERMSIILFC